MAKKYRKNLKKYSNLRQRGSQMRLKRLLKSLDEKLELLNKRELEKEKYLESSARILIDEAQYSEDLLIMLSEELYQELCKHIGSDKIGFMGIA